jgi:hypothetical protein
MKGISAAKKRELLVHFLAMYAFCRIMLFSALLLQNEEVLTKHC